MPSKQHRALMRSIVGETPEIDTKTGLEDSSRGVVRLGVFIHSQYALVPDGTIWRVSTPNDRLKVRQSLAVLLDTAPCGS